MKNILIIFLFFILSSVHAAPYTYTFKQGGFSGGEILNGKFTGDDINGDGWLTSFHDNSGNIYGEVSNFSIGWNGGCCDWSANWSASEGSDLDFELNFHLDGSPSWIGDDTNGNEFITAAGVREIYPDVFRYYSYFGFIETVDDGDIFTRHRSFSSELIEVSGGPPLNVPIPASMWLFISGLITVFTTRKIRHI